MSNLKVEGKVSDWCPKCKNCKGMTRESNGVHDWLTEVECEDPYDGMTKTLNADSDICCSMFEPKKEKESFNLNMPSRIISEEEYNALKKNSDSWRDRYYEVRYALRKDETLDESISCVRDIPSDVEMIEDLKKRAADSDYWRKLYNSLSETCADYDKRCKEECEKKCRDEISKLQNIVTEKEVELKKRLKDNVYLTQNKLFADTAIEKNKKLNQTISDQEITIKALLLTIKEMCKEDETNE